MFLLSLLPTLLTSLARAESPSFPAISTALQDDATALWMNSANFAFSPAVTTAYAINITPNQNYFTYAKQNGIIGWGVNYTNSAEFGTWWSLASALSLKLDKHLSFGATSTWHSIEYPNGINGDNLNADTSFTRWNVGLGWRPLQWLGIGGSIQNIGQNSTSLTPESLTVGLGLSTLQNRLQIAGDYVSNTDDIFSNIGDFRTTVRLRPTQGLSLQGQMVNVDEFGGGLSIGYGFGDIGGYAQTGTENQFTLLGTSGVNDTSIVARGRRVALFELDGAIPYRSESGLFQSSTETYFSLLQRIHHACTDPAIKGVVFHIKGLGLSMAQVDELRQEMMNARERNKEVLVYLDGSAGNTEYYLASAATTIYAHPAGSIEMIGLHSERIYLKDFLDQVGIKAEFVRRSDYKSAPEQYTHNAGSEASKEQSNALLDDIYAHLTNKIADSRGIPVATVSTLINNSPLSTPQANEKGLVDELIYPDELEDILDDKFGIFHRLEENYGYSRPDGWSSASDIAIIPITGVIMGGRSQSPGLFGGSYSAGSQTIVGQLNEAADDSSVKAIVIRVDSPGGSAFASDEIWRAVVKAKEEKPVIVSMGGVAASGGYYVSAAADEIFAEETTITGSIGVYSGKYNASGLIAMLGINVESSDRGENAALYSTFQPWTEGQRAKMEEQVEITYQQFKKVVSDGRELSLEDVENVAQGHVWSGSKAKEIGLVDQNGGLFEAIEFAQKEAGIRGEQIRLVQYEEGSGSYFYKYEVAINETLEHLQNPLASEKSFLEAVSQEHLWMLSDIWLWP